MVLAWEREAFSTVDIISSCWKLVVLNSNINVQILHYYLDYWDGGESMLLGMDTMLWYSIYSFSLIPRCSKLEEGREGMPGTQCSAHAFNLEPIIM